MRACLSLLIGLFGVGAALADAPETSLRPMPRPISVQPAETPALIEPVAMQPAARSALRPQRRPDAAPLAAPQQPRKGLFGLIKPRAKPAKTALVSRKGSVCDDPLIKGEALARISSKTNGCGLDEPVRITSVDGVRLSQAATIDCATASALKTWVQNGLQPAFGRDEVVELNVAAHYICRTRNNVRGAKISEHGRGKAIDISGFVLASGKKIPVQGNYNKTMRKAHQSACGVFSTTLGPGSDGYHEDNLHYDTASRRSGGAYCR